MRSNLILTASLLLLPAVGLAAAPPMQPVKVPAAGGAVSVKIPPKPDYVREVGDRKIAAWSVTVSVTRGSREVLITQTNAADIAAAAGITHEEKWETYLSARNPWRAELLTWGARPVVGTKTEHIIDDADPPQSQDPPPEERPVPQPAPPDEKRPPLKPGRPVPPRPPAPSRGPGPGR